ncbi:MAG: response regulator [Bdellovibrionaceae bacterium]|nr:response regulator [Pseudobdellovibrionaceae bacterium]
MSNSVLIVDDEDEIRELIGLQLEDPDRHFYFAANGLEAIDILNKEKIDLVISDIAMPKMNGFELLRKIKLLGLNTPVIILTGHADSMVANQLRTYSVRSFINKPWNRAELEDAVSSVLKK